jgi:hypothetical protein
MEMLQENIFSRSHLGPVSNGQKSQMPTVAGHQVPARSEKELPNKLKTLPPIPQYRL